VAALLGLLALWLLAAVLGALIGNGASPDAGLPKDQRIGLLVGGIHTDILLPLTAETRAAFAFAESAGVPVLDPGAEWLIVGWGSKAFYTATGTYADMRAETVWTAATGDAAVIRLDVAGRIEDFSNILMVPVNADQMGALRSAILAEFTAREALPEAGFTWSDAFFPAKGHFSALNTCNVWMARMMKAGDIPYGIWTPAPFSVRLAHRWHKEP
jgi:uncharacterized protein (TIGR02117 family)